MIVTKEQEDTDKLKSNLSEVVLPNMQIQNNGMQAPLTQDSDWRINHLKRKTTKIGVLCGVTICILLCVVVALAVLLFESRHAQPMKDSDLFTMSKDMMKDTAKDITKDMDTAYSDQLADSVPKDDNVEAKESAIVPDRMGNETDQSVITISVYHEELVGLLDDNNDFPDISEEFQYATPQQELENNTEIDSFTSNSSEGELGVALETEEEEPQFEEEEPQLVTKDEWSGMEPLATEPQAHPTPYVVICQTDGKPCYNKESCSQEMRDLQSFHMQTQLLPNIGDNFYIGGDGRVYVGRGWDVTNYHVGFVRHKNIGICFIGDFYSDVPTSAQLTAAKELISYGVSNQKLNPDYRLLAHNQILLPDSKFMGPGDNLLHHIDTWPHRCFNSCDVTSSTDNHNGDNTKAHSYGDQFLLQFLGLG